MSGFIFLGHDGRPSTTPARLPGLVGSAVREAIIDARVNDPSRLRMDDRGNTCITAEGYNRWEYRQDAMAPGASGFPRDYDYVLAEVLKERRPELNGMLLPEDSRTPLGAKTVTARRRTGQGRAAFHSGGTSFNLISSGEQEVQRPVHYIGIGVQRNDFDVYADSYAGKNAFQDDVVDMTRYLDEFQNEVDWYGAPAQGLHGALWHPGLTREAFTVTFDSATSGDNILSALHDFVNRAHIDSGGTFRPNKLGVSPKIMSYLQKKRLNSAGGSQSVATVFLQDQATKRNGITEIVEISELAASELALRAHLAVPSGQEGLFLWRDDINSIRRLTVADNFLLAPHRTSVLDELMVMVRATAGVLQMDVGDNAFGWATVS